MIARDRSSSQIARSASTVALASSPGGVPTHFRYTPCIVMSSSTGDLNPRSPGRSSLLEAAAGCCCEAAQVGGRARRPRRSRLSTFAATERFRTSQAGSGAQHRQPAGLSRRAHPSTPRRAAWGGRPEPPLALVRWRCIGLSSSISPIRAARRPIAPARPGRRHEDQAGEPHLQESRHGERQVEQVFHPIFSRFPGPKARLSISSGQQSVGVCPRARPPGAWSVSFIPAS
jgi:hypothetical protein